MLQLVFKNGVASPVFHVSGSSTDDFVTSKVKTDKRINFAKLRVCDNRIVERIQFLNKKEEGKDADPSDILAKIQPCSCGDDEWFEVPAEHQIVGIFGLISTNQYLDPNQKKEFDNIRGLGFITMNIDA